MAKDKTDPRTRDLATPNSTTGVAASITDDAGVTLTIEETGAPDAPGRVILSDGGNGSKARITWSPTRVQLLEAVANMVYADLAGTGGGSDDGREFAASTLASIVDEIEAAKHDPAVAAFRESQLAADGEDVFQSWEQLPLDDNDDNGQHGKRTWRRRWNAAVAVIRT